MEWVTYKECRGVNENLKVPARATIVGELVECPYLVGTNCFASNTRCLHLPPTLDEYLRKVSNS